MTVPTPAQIKPQPGVQRDGTVFDSPAYIDAQWTRFYRERPKKMGGYISIINSLPHIVHGMSSYTKANVTYVHTGSAQDVLQSKINSSGSFSGLTDRTPAGLTVNADRLWQMEVFYDNVAAKNMLIAHGPPNLSDISSSVIDKIYYGDVTTATLLTDTAVVSESGGIVAVPPYLFKFGNDGHVAWCVPNKPTDFAGVGSGEAWVTSQKIVRGFPLRGGGNGPAVILWSLDTLIRGSFVGSTAGYWAFDSLAGDISILSSQGVIEYDSNFYWAGLDRFMVFNGVARELTNEYNMEWFFKNLNAAQRQKVFAFKVPRYGEIWWCFPYGDATECTHAIVYNVRKNFWYDTLLPNGGRSCGIYAKVYSKPLMTGSIATSDGFGLWQHETGVDEVNGSEVEPVQAFFQTNEITLLADVETPQNKALSVSRLEPDFQQLGSLRLTVHGRANAKATEITSAVYTIPEVPATPYEQMVGLKITHRLMSFRFESNVAGGDYEMGKTLIHLAESDGRELQ